MNVSTWSIRRPIPAVLLFVVLTVAGLLGFRAMKVQNMPDVDLPIVTVAVALPGAAPAQLETDVVRKLENVLSTVQGVKNLSASIVEGGAVLSAEFRLEKNLQEALDDVRNAIGRVRADLPPEMREPVVAKLELAGLPILTYTVASQRMDPEALSWFVDDTVAKAMLAVRGVGSVVRVGGVTREVRVELDPMRLLALNASAADISRQLQQVQQDAAGGRANLGGAEQSMRTVASVRSAEELARLEINLGDGRRLRLEQVATVSDTVAEPRALAILDGRPVVAFEVTRARGAGELEVAAGVRQALQQLRAAHPDVTLTEAFNFVDPARENFDSSMMLLLEGALLAVLVVWVFLRDWRSTFIAAVALPLSAIPTFAAMHFLGFTLNGVSLLSLSLVVGILVDDAIVEIENILRHLRAGKTPMQAAIDAADEIGLAVIATTFTLVAVFLPTAFMSGVVGKFFVQFGWTAAIAVWFSLLVARMLTPMMAAYLLRPWVGPAVNPALGPQSAPSGQTGSGQGLGAGGHEERPAWLQKYLQLARWCLRHRAATLLLTLVFVAATLALASRLPTGFMPADDLSQTQVTLLLPPGGTLEKTRQMAERASTEIRKNPHVQRVYTAIGGGSAGADVFAPQGLSDVRRATLTVNMTPRQQRAGVRKQEVEAQLRQALAELPGTRVRVGLGASAERYTLVLSGSDGRALADHALKLERELRALPGIGAVTSSSNAQRPELVVRPDADKAADLGVTTAAIGNTLRIATAGDYEQGLSKLNLAQRQVPVVVRLPAQAREDLALLERLPVPGARGPVMLSSVAQLSLESGPAQIDRRNRQRNVNIDIELNGRSLGEFERQALQLPSLAQLPPGITRASVGDAEAMGELFAGFALAMVAGVLCIYIVLVLLFHDFVQPLTILVALVLAIPGAFLALYLTRSDISMPAMIGLIMLMGIAAKNSILLVDYVVIARRDHGMSRGRALFDACSKRARPIIMTTVAMGAGMLPVALGWGSDPSFRAPMAIVVIGGLITSTVMSLLVVPVVFTLVDDAVQALQRRWGHARPAPKARPNPSTPSNPSTLSR